MSAVGAIIFSVASEPRMVALGFGKFVRADKIYALEPLTGGDRGGGRRTRVWVEGIAEPIGQMRECPAQRMAVHPDPQRVGRRRVRERLRARQDHSNLDAKGPYHKGGSSPPTPRDHCRPSGASTATTRGQVVKRPLSL